MCLAMVKQKWHRICRKKKTVRDMRKNPIHHQDRVPASTEICSNHLFYYLYLCMCMKSCKKTVKTIKTPGGGSIITFVRNLEILRSRRRLHFKNNWKTHVYANFQTIFGGNDYSAQHAHKFQWYLTKEWKWGRKTKKLHGLPSTKIVKSNRRSCPRFYNCCLRQFMKLSRF